MEVKDEQSQPQDEAIVFPTPHPSLLQDQHQHHHEEDEAFLITTDTNTNTTTTNTNTNIVHNHDANNSTTFVGKEVEKGHLDSFPPGYRFCPLDHELVVHYLKKKVMNEPLPHNKIREVDLYLHNPEKLTEEYQGLGEKEWYFFTPRNRKYRNGTRPNRAAGGGYWKATGADRPVKHEGVLVGLRKALVFYEGKPPNGEKTSWIMHEYRVDEPPRNKRSANDMRLDDWVLCRVYKKTEKFVKVHQQDEGRESVGNSKPLPDEDHTLFPHENNIMEQYHIGDYSDELLNTYIPPSNFHNEISHHFIDGSSSPLKFAKLNNNLMMPSHYGALPFRPPPAAYSTENVVFRSKEEIAWATNPRGYHQGDVWSISNTTDSCDLSSQYFSNTSYSESLRSLEKVLQDNTGN